MTDIRNLRLSLQQKLEDRRRLITENASIRSKNESLRGQRDFLLNALKNPLVEMAMEDMADKIINAVLVEAIKASGAVANRTGDGGSYEIGISIPSLHIRHRIHRMEFDAAGSSDEIRPSFIRRMEIKT